MIVCADSRSKFQNCLDDTLLHRIFSLSKNRAILVKRVSMRTLFRSEVLESMNFGRRVCSAKYYFVVCGRDSC